jgi:penicillin amidase
MQYQALEITTFQPWTALDSAIIGKAIFQLSFDLDIDAAELPAVSATLSGTGTGDVLRDVFRSTPPDSSERARCDGQRPFLGKLGGTHFGSLLTEGEGPGSGKRYDSVPFLKNTLARTEQQIGSNEWAVAGSLTTDGRALVANDPHLSLDLPANFYQIHLVRSRAAST